MRSEAIPSGLGCVVLAAGNAVRFGGGKLDAQVEGKTLLRRALEAVPTECFAAVAVVVQSVQATALAQEFGFLAVRNPTPERGVSSSLRLGLQALPPCGGVLFQVADQPYLTRETAAGLVRTFLDHPSRIICASHDGRRGNPCLFPARFFSELLALEGDVGGGAVIKRHPEAVRLVEAPARVLADVDSRDELERLRHIGG